MSSKGTILTVQVDKSDLASVLRGLRGAPKEFNAALRQESKQIAGRVMVPAYASAARAEGSPWGAGQQAGITARSDRLVKVAVGGRRKAYSGGASTIMLRNKSGSKQWMPAARRKYGPQAMEMWRAALTRVCVAWNYGRP